MENNDLTMTEKGILADETNGMYTPESEADVNNEVIGEKIKLLIENFISTLSTKLRRDTAKRNLEFLSMYMLEGKTLQDIGNAYSISRERVRQIIDKYKRRLTGKTAKPLREECLALLKNVPDDNLPEFLYLEIEKKHNKKLRKLLETFYFLEKGKIILKYNPASVKSVTKLEKQEPKGNAVKTKPTRAGLPWNEEEDEMLENEYAEGMKISQIAKSHERTRGAIRARLEKHGHIK